MSNKLARSLVRNSVQVGAQANRSSAGAWASATSGAEGFSKGKVASAKTGAYAFAWANKHGDTVGEASAWYSSWAGKPTVKAAKRTNLVTFSCHGSKWKSEFRKRCRIQD